VEGKFFHMQEGSPGSAPGVSSFFVLRAVVSYLLPPGLRENQWYTKC
jgi:hypothetical protein